MDDHRLPMDDHRLAADLAVRARDLLLRRRRELEAAGRPLVTWGDVGDREANVLLVDALRDARPGDAILSEESTDDPARLERRRVWIVDPLDGTREFAEPGRTDWAVHVALAVGGEPVVGAVALADGSALSTAEPPPPPGPAPTERRLRLVVSRSRPPALADFVAARLGAEVVSLGSAGAKVAAVVRGEVDVYLHAGGMRQWDSCAPVAVALAAGCHASALDGSPLRYNGASVDLDELLVCRADLAGSVLAAIRAS